MRKTEKKQESQKKVKSKLLAAFAMLLISLILVVVAGYAWLTMSIAPEVTGINTNIGSNGSLEIALLNTNTRQDLNQIKTAIGQSLANKVTAANNTWGNLIDLTDESYGLNNIVLLPSRLNSVKKTGGGYSVNTGMLSVPTYGYDGRIIDLTDNTFSAIYKNSTFSYSNIQDYGVRAIGTADTISVRDSAIALAKSNIKTYSNNANSHTSAILQRHGNDLFSLLINHATSSGDEVYGDSDIQVLEAMISDLQVSVDYIDLAMRQTLIAYCASVSESESDFIALRNLISDSDKNIDGILKSLEVAMPDDFDMTWIDTFTELQNDLNQANNQLKLLTGGEYTWAELRSALDILINMDQIFIGDVKYNQMTSEDIAGLMNSDFIEVTLSSGSGVLADISDFTGDYSSNIKFGIMDITIRTLSQVNPNYLSVISDKIDKLSVSDDSAERDYNISSTYGYAIDLAFRCNAPISDLLLQTDAMQRIYEDSASPTTLGGGSFMEFSRANADYSLEQATKLMDALRVAFIDDQGNILCVAKLNMSNRVVGSKTIKAPLYIYDYEISEEEEDKGAMIMGERRKFDNKIVSLDQNVAKAITVLVWLDGDVVDNTMVSAESETSLNGTLNLQFASSADLIPADNNALQYLSTDISGLNKAVETNKETYENGQNMYTTVSWTAFAEAYEYAKSIVESEEITVNSTQVYIANKQLVATAQALEEISIEALQNAVAQMREFMGTSDDIARYVIYDEESGSIKSLSEYTEENKDKNVATIFRVNYEKNLKDEGNGVKSVVYTNESWSNLAAALYDAESLVKFDSVANFERVNNALTALDLAYKALERNVFYLPYDYEGALYYFAISNEEDTYGKWYDESFKKVISDLRILELDAKARPAEIAYIEQDEFIENISSIISPVVKLKSEIYASLKTEEILAVHWNSGTKLVLSIDSKQRTYIAQMIDIAKELGVDPEQYASAVELLEKGTDNILETPTREEAIAEITRLEAVIDNANKQLEALALTNDEMRSLLLAAIHKATEIEGYSNENEEFAELADILGEATNYVARNDEQFKIIEAYELFSSINEQLVAYDMDEIALIEYKAITDDQIELLNMAINRAEAIIAENEAAGEEAALPAENLDAIKAVVSEANSTTIEDLSQKSAQVLLEKLNNNIVACGGKAVESAQIEAMTEDQRIVLTTAVNNAKTIEGIDVVPEEGEEDTFAKLKEIIAEIESILSSESGVTATKEYAQSLIDSINEQLKKYGLKEVTEYNTILHTLPLGSEILNVTNSVDFASSIMHTSGETGEATINAIVLTKNGVVLKVEKKLTIYDKIESAEIIMDDDKSEHIVGDTVKFFAQLTQKQYNKYGSDSNQLFFILEENEENKIYSALYKLDLSDKHLVKADDDGNIVYDSDDEQVFVDGDDFIINIKDGKIVVLKLEVNEENEPIYSEMTSLDYDSLYAVDEDKNLYLISEDKFIKITNEGEIIEYVAYFEEGEFDGYFYADNIIKSGSHAYRIEKSEDDQSESRVYIGNILVDEDNWSVGQIVPVTVNTSYGEEIDYCTWSSSNVNVVKIIDNVAGECTVELTGSGVAQLSVTIYTKQGNSYTISYVLPNMLG